MIILLKKKDTRQAVTIVFSWHGYYIGRYFVKYRKCNNWK